jgi:hypothetical protein
MSTTSSGIAFVANATFTRPSDTTAYASGDMVANSTTAGSVAALQFLTATPVAGVGRIDAVRIRKSGTSTTNASFRVHFFNTAPTIASGDNAAFSTSGSSTYIGAMDVTVDRAFTDGSCGRGTPVTVSPILLTTNNTTLFGLVEARGAYTPASGEVFELLVEGYKF